MAEFELVSDFEAAGDQPKAIGSWPRASRRGTSTRRSWASPGPASPSRSPGLIAEVQRPTLILAPNKSLAAQLAAEFREFFPKNRVEYFVSYYDYYQPEAYLPSSDTYIEKDSSINDEIDRLRHSATQRAAQPAGRRDHRPSVSAIYGLGSPETYATQLLTLESARSTTSGRSSRLVELQYERNDMVVRPQQVPRAGRHDRDLPGVRGARHPRQLFGDEIERISVGGPGHR